MINWEPLLEGHVRGSCSRGVVWIRLNREEKVSGIYFMFEKIEKLVPKLDADVTLSGAKKYAEDMLELMELQAIKN
jgi:hypothetical protein